MPTAIGHLRISTGGNIGPDLVGCLLMSGSRCGGSVPTTINHLRTSTDGSIATDIVGCLLLLGIMLRRLDANLLWPRFSQALLAALYLTLSISTCTLGIEQRRINACSRWPPF